VLDDFTLQHAQTEYSLEAVQKLMHIVGLHSPSSIISVEVILAIVGEVDARPIITIEMLQGELNKPKKQILEQDSPGRKKL
jgi:hypothetical protein